jgi:hypothetical protein
MRKTERLREGRRGGRAKPSLMAIVNLPHIEEPPLAGTPFRLHGVRGALGVVADDVAERAAGLLKASAP